MKEMSSTLQCCAEWDAAATDAMVDVGTGKIPYTGVFPSGGDFFVTALSKIFSLKRGIRKRRVVGNETRGRKFLAAR